MKLSIVVGLAAWTLTTLVAVHPAKAAQSHLLQAPEKHVVLKSVVIDDRNPAKPCGAFWDKEFAEVSPTGTVADTAFSVPDGYSLVVTDIDWRVDPGPTSFLPGDVLQFTIFLGAPNATVFSVGRLIGDYATPGVMVESTSLTAGFRVGPGTPICPLALGVDKEGFARHEVTFMILRGYLIQDSGRKATR